MLVAENARRSRRARRLKELLRTKLIECGWRDELKEHCKEVLKSKGKEKVTIEDLAAEIAPHGRGAGCTPRASRA